MKRIRAIGVLLLLSFSSIAQPLKASRVPSIVRAAFSRQFPGSHPPKWAQSKGGYSATFRQNGKLYTACYTPDGEWTATESPVKWSWQLPKPAQESWGKSAYKDWLILGIKKVEEPGQTLYALDLGLVQSLGPDDSDIGDEYILYFSGDGVLVKKDHIE